jgi:hypothetical protein
MSCQSDDKKTKSTSTIDSIEKKLTENNLTTVIDEPEDRNIQIYQSQKQTWEKEHSIKLPENIDVKLLYEKTNSTVKFISILRLFENYFLTQFYSGTDVEKNYYATFDINGNLLDVILIGTRTYGVDFTAEFTHNNLIKILHSHKKEFEIDEEGNSAYNNISINGEYIYLKKSGLFQLINVNNSKTATSEIAPSILDYYKIKISNQFPKESYNIYTFSKIPGNNTSSTEDVYESLEGGGLYSSCLEIRNTKNDLIGVIGYKNETCPDTILQTFSFVLNKNPIIHYSIISVSGRLYLELISLLPKTHENAIQITKEYYLYPQEDHSTLIQTPTHTISGSLDVLFGKPLGKNIIAKLK